jgi:glycosyltransferase involved in cell wall biosynthesis
MEKLISVVIPAYNRAATLSRAINSVLHQTYRNVEAIIIDDASSDDVLNVVANYNTGAIRCIRHEVNKGGAEARNTGIANANGEFLAFLDSDDEWLPGKLEKQMALITTKGSEYGLIYTGVNICGEAGKLLRTVSASFDGDAKEKILVRNFITTTSSVFTRRAVVAQAGCFDPAMRSCQDWDLFIRLCRICKVACVDQTLVNHYWNDANNRISKNSEAVVAGHKAIQSKYRKEIKALPRPLRLKHSEELSFTYFDHGERRLAMQLLVEAFFISGNPLYLAKACVRSHRYKSGVP